MLKREQVYFLVACVMCVFGLQILALAALAEALYMTVILCNMSTIRVIGKIVNCRNNEGFYYLIHNQMCLTEIRT